MAKSKADYLLLLSEFFYKKAQGIPSTSVEFKKALKYVFGPLDNNDIDQWANNNASSLRGIESSLYWSGMPNQDQIYLRREERDGKVVISFISSEPLKFNDFEAIESSILTPYKNIPKLYLNTGYFDYTPRANKNISLDEAHNYFVVQSLEKFYINKHDIPDFIKDNKEKINELRKYFTFPPKYLGGGADGAAFQVGPNLVLKLFTDTSAYEAALEAMERLHKKPSLAKTEAMIYDVGTLGNIGEKNIYYYFIEKMAPIKSDDIPFDLQDDISRLLGDIKHSAREYMYYGEEWGKLKEAFNTSSPEFGKLLQKASAFVKDRVSSNLDYDYVYKKISKQLNLRSNWFDSLIEEIIVKYLTHRTDLHAGNIGVTNYGDLRYFDPAYQEVKNNI